MFASSFKKLFSISLIFVVLLVATKGYCKSEEPNKCSLTIIGNDAMEFRDEKNKLVSEIKFPSSCQTLTIKFYYDPKGTLPASSMGHSLVFTTKENKTAIAKEAFNQGPKNNYLPKKNNPKVIAASQFMLGGGKNDKKEDLIIIKREQIKTKNDLVYFCSFPGHDYSMSGPFIVESTPEEKAPEVVANKAQPSKSQTNTKVVVG